MSNVALVESIPRKPLHFVLSPFDNHEEQYTLKVTNNYDNNVVLFHSHGKVLTQLLHNFTSLLLVFIIFCLK